MLPGDRRRKIETSIFEKNKAEVQSEDFDRTFSKDLDELIYGNDPDFKKYIQNNNLESEIINEEGRTYLKVDLAGTSDSGLMRTQEYKGILYPGVYMPSRNTAIEKILDQTEGPLAEDSGDSYVLIFDISKLRAADRLKDKIGNSRADVTLKEVAHVLNNYCLDLKDSYISSQIEELLDGRIGGDEFILHIVLKKEADQDTDILLDNIETEAIRRVGNVKIEFVVENNNGELETKDGELISIQENVSIKDGKAQRIKIPKLNLEKESSNISDERVLMYFLRRGLLTDKELIKRAKKDISLEELKESEEDERKRRDPNRFKARKIIKNGVEKIIPEVDVLAEEIEDLLVASPEYRTSFLIAREADRKETEIRTEKNINIPKGYIFSRQLKLFLNYEFKLKNKLLKKYAYRRGQFVERMYTVSEDASGEKNGSFLAATIYKLPFMKESNLKSLYWGDSLILALDNRIDKEIEDYLSLPENELNDIQKKFIKSTIAHGSEGVWYGIGYRELDNTILGTHLKNIKDKLDNIFYIKPFKNSDVALPLGISTVDLRNFNYKDRSSGDLFDNLLEESDRSFYIALYDELITNYERYKDIFSGKDVGIPVEKWDFSNIKLSDFIKEYFLSPNRKLERCYEFLKLVMELHEYDEDLDVTSISDLSNPKAIEREPFRRFKAESLKKEDYEPIEEEIVKEWMEEGKIRGINYNEEELKKLWNDSTSDKWLQILYYYDSSIDSNTNDSKLKIIHLIKLIMRDEINKKEFPLQIAA